MFNQEHLSQIDKQYFNVIMLDGKDVTIQSRNTGHYWYLHCAGYPTEEALVIFHKHRFSHPYHQHGRANTLRQAIRSIQGHVYFEIEAMTDAAAYAALKAAIHNAYPFFDGNALDAARFIFGADSGEAVWHEGWTTIDEEVVVELPDEETASGSGPILEGNRNNAMSRFAGRVLKRYGNTEKAHDAFMEHAQKCDPPLSDEELAIIWASAIRFFNKKVVGQDGYVPPEEYNQDFDGVSLEPEDFSDIGEAKVLAREYEDELIYSDATSFLRYDGTCWCENKQDAVGAVEEFLDMQLVDARDELNRCIEVLVEAGLPEKVVKAGGKALEKLITPELEKAYGAYLAAKNYYAFVMKCRNFKNLVNVQNAVKPMIQIKVEDLDANENMLNTPDATYDLRKGIQST